MMESLGTSGKSFVVPGGGEAHTVAPPPTTTTKWFVVPTPRHKPTTTKPIVVTGRRGHLETTKHDDRRLYIGHTDSE